jgi:hypothetical protein
METVDLSAYFVVYNLVIGVLVMTSSEKLGVYVGAISKAHQARLQRLTQLSTFAFGACVAVLSGSIYLFFHILRLGV